EVADAPLVLGQQADDELLGGLLEQLKVHRHAAARVEHDGDGDGLDRVVEEDDLLRSLLIEDLEVVAGEAAHEPLVLVGDGHVDGHRLRTGREGGLRRAQARQRQRRRQREKQVSPRDHHPVAYHRPAGRTRARRRRGRASALLAAWVLAAVLAGTADAASGAAAAAQPVPSRHVVASAAEAGWTLAITAETASGGLDGARVEASSGSGTVQVPLGGVPVWRMARAVSAMYVHAPSDRLVVL